MKTIMKFKKMEPSKKIIRLLSLFSLIFGIVALIWLIYDYVLYHKLRLTMLETTELGKLEIFGGFVWISYLYMFIYHILANGTLILYTRYFRRIQVLQVIALMLGVVSFLSLFGDWAVLGDIGKEYKMGWDISGEWKILNIFLGIHTVYIMLVTAIRQVWYEHKRYPRRTGPWSRKTKWYLPLHSMSGLYAACWG